VLTLSLNERSNCSMMTLYLLRMLVKIPQDAFDSFVCSPVYFFAFLLREELNEQLELKRKEKKKMRKILKKFEDDFFEETGRYVAYDLAHYSCDIQLCYRQKQCSSFQAVTGKTCRL